MLKRFFLPILPGCLNVWSILESAFLGAIQFGIATLTFGGKNVGYLQNVTIDFAFDQASLFSGATLYPIDVRVHTGTITGNAEFADIDAVTFQKLLGGSIAGDVLTVNNSASPSTFQLVLTLITDTVTFSITLVKCRSTKLSMAFARDNHLIPNFDFSAESNDAGQVATIDVGDVS